MIKDQPLPPITTRCKQMPRLVAAGDGIHLMCECGFQETLGHSPSVPDAVFSWEKHINKNITRKRVIDEDSW